MTILIVEDYATLRILIRHWLEMAFPGCTVVEASSGEEAIMAARATDPTVILMDIGLPNITGIEAMKIIKSENPNTKVLMLTIHEEAAYREEAFRAGADGYLPKRTMNSDLLPVLRKCIGAADKDHRNEGTSD